MLDVDTSCVIWNATGNTDIMLSFILLTKVNTLKVETPNCVCISEIVVETHYYSTTHDIIHVCVRNKGTIAPCRGTYPL